MELRSKIARLSFVTFHRHGRRLTEESAWDALHEYDQGYWLAVADAILAIPEIRDALILAGVIDNPTKVYFRD